jgi:prolyl 4-hydroxylase
MTEHDHANSLLRAGRTAEAVAALEQAGRGGSADAWVQLAYLYLAGSAVPRDLALTRACFGRAAALGDAAARMTFLSLLGNGTGGPRDWPGALRLLKEAARDDARAAREVELVAAMEIDDDGNPRQAPVARSLQQGPPTHLFERMLTPAECAAIAAAALPGFAPSVVIDPVTGQAVPHPVRTSDNASFPWVLETPFIHAINRRFAAASATEATCGEPLQVLRYRPGQEFKPHFDALPPGDNQRVLTMIAYLNGGYGGGETLFVTTGLRVAGGVGDVLMFRNAHPDGSPDPQSQHAGLPVTRGEKLVATRWIRQHRFGPV